MARVLTLWLNSKLWIYGAFIPFHSLNCTNVWHYIMFDHKIHFIIVKLLKKESMVIFLRCQWTRLARILDSHIVDILRIFNASQHTNPISEFYPWSPISFDAVHSAFPSCIWGFTATTDLVPAVGAVFSLVLCILLYECIVFYVMKGVLHIRRVSVFKLKFNLFYKTVVFFLIANNFKVFVFLLFESSIT